MAGKIFSNWISAVQKVLLCSGVLGSIKQVGFCFCFFFPDNEYAFSCFTYLIKS